jgi:Icc-related predicted phosphoesterase
MRRTVRYILATSNPMGDLEALEKFVKVAPDTGADAVAVIGNLMPKTAKSRDYAAFFRILSETHLPTAYIPGPEDAPIWEYLREAANTELVRPEMRNVHETFTFWKGPYLVAGAGGEILDDGEPEEKEALRYPAWVAEYHLKTLWELKDYPKIFLFYTRPFHKGLGEGGSHEVAHLIKTHNPLVAIVAGRGQKHEMLGASWVVVPGDLSEGEYSLLDLRSRKLETGNVR